MSESQQRSSAPAETRDVFLSYHRRDRELAAAVAKALEVSGLSVWWDIRIEPGANWVSEIDAALAGSRAFVALVTGGAFSPWVTAEVNAAIRRFFERAPEGGGEALRIVPLMAEGVSHVPHALLAQFQTVKLRGAPSAASIEALVAALALAPTVPFESHPWRGLEPYGAEHGHLFFGRQVETKELLERFEQGRRRWLQVEGASGSGKSSLVRAGFLPEVLRRAPQEAWALAQMRPGANPVRELASALHGASQELSPPRSGFETERLESRLRDSAEALSAIARELGSRLLLVVDQFEELGTVSERESRLAFERGLDAALRDADGPLRLVTTVRSDLVNVLESGPLATHLNTAARYVVAPPGAEALREVISRPLQRAGGKFRDPGLLDLLVREALATPGALPLLSHVLGELWKRDAETGRGRELTQEAYESLGGMAGALSHSADAVLERLGPQRATAERLLVELVHPARGGRDVRRARVRDELLRGLGPDAEQVLVELSGGRERARPGIVPGPSAPRLVVVRPAGPGEPCQVELVHEALLEKWGTLRALTDRSRRDLEKAQEIETAAQAWRSAGSSPEALPPGDLLAYYDRWDHARPALSEQAETYLKQARGEVTRRRRNQRLVQFGFAAAALFFAAVAGLAYRQTRAAEMRRLQALEVAKAILVDVDDGLLKYAEVSTVRRDLVNRAGELLDKLGGDTAAQADTRRLRLLAHQHRGDQAMAYDDKQAAGQEYKAAPRALPAVPPAAGTSAVDSLSP